MKILGRFTPLECEEGKDKHGNVIYQCRYLERAVEEVGGQKIETTEVKRIKSRVPLEIGKEVLVELSVFAIDGRAYYRVERLAK